MQKRNAEICRSLVFDLPGYHFRRTEMEIQETEKTLRKGMGSWDGYIYRARSISEETRQGGHLFSTALNGSGNWPGSMERVMGVKRWESKIL